MDKWDSTMTESSIGPNRIALCLPVPVSSWQKAEGVWMVAAHWRGVGTCEPAAELLHDCLLPLQGTTAGSLYGQVGAF